MKVRNLMTSDVAMVAPGDGLDRAGRPFLLSLDGIARASSRGEALIASLVSAADVGLTLGQICRPHLLGMP